MTNAINSIEFGVENLHIAKLDESTMTYETPAKVVGTVSISLKQKVDETSLFADNSTFKYLISNNGYEGELEIYNYDDNFKEKYLGFKKDTNGVLVEPNILIPSKNALLFTVLGDVSNRATVLYSVTFGKPDMTHKTLGDKLTVEAMKIKFKATAVEFTGYEGKVIQTTTTDSDLKATWFTKVYTPNQKKTKATN